MGQTKGAFGIIVSGDDHLTVWPTGRKPPPGWRFTGSTGTKAEMQAIVQQQFVSTLPAMRADPGPDTADPRWAATMIEE